MITSAKNERIKDARTVREGRDPSRVFVEGQRLVGEALEAGLEVEAVLGLPELRSRFEGRMDPALWIDVTSGVMKSLADTVSPQGVALIAQRPQSCLANVWSAPGTPLILVLDRLQDPGNVGTLIRTAEAAGVTGVVALAGSADPFSPKALRSSMGSAFRLPVVTGETGPEVLREAADRGFSILAADGLGAVPFLEVDWRGPLALVLGNEGRGVDPELMGLCQKRVTIPMAGQVESLNVATAGAVLLFEAARQRTGL